MSSDYDPVVHMASVIATTEEVISYHRTLHLLARNRTMYCHNNGITYGLSLIEMSLHARFVSDLETTLKMQRGILVHLKNQSE